MNSVPEGPLATASRDLELFTLAHRIVDLVLHEIQTEAAKPGVDLSIDRLNDGVNPFYDQTDSGFFLEWSYSAPNQLWTPWGSWKIIGVCSYSGNPWAAIDKRIIERVGGLLHSPLRVESIGEVGPIYALTQIDNQLLPTPTMRAQHRYASYAEVNAAWEGLERNFRSGGHA